MAFRRWLRIMPIFLVSWLAKRKLEKYHICNMVVVEAFDDTLFIVRK